MCGSEDEVFESDGDSPGRLFALDPSGTLGSETGCTIMLPVRAGDSVRHREVMDSSTPQHFLHSRVHSDRFISVG